MDTHKNNGVAFSWLRIITKSFLKHVLAPIGLFYRPSAGVRVLFYHRVNQHRFSLLGLVSREITVATNQFDKQMAYLVREGYRTLTLDEMAEIIAGRQPYDPKSVLITFDDGYVDNLMEAAPILKKYGLSAVVFPVSGLVGADNALWPMGDTPQLGQFMSWSQLQTWCDAGHEIGSHTCSHPILTHIPAQDMEGELSQSRLELSRTLERQIDSVAYPFGDVNEAVRAGAKAAGYRLGFTTRSGTNAVGCDPLNLKRTEVSRSDTQFIFKLKMRGYFDWLGVRDTVFYRALMRKLHRLQSRVSNVSSAGENHGKKSQPIRVAMLVTRMDIGGVPDHVMTLLEGFGPSIHVTLICDHIHESHRRILTAKGVQIVFLPMKRLLSGFSDLKTLKNLKAILRDGQFDVLHTHMSKAALLGAVVGMTDRKIRVINTAHNLGFIAMPQQWKKSLFWFYDKMLVTVGIDVTVTVSQKVAEQAIQAKLLPAKSVQVIRNGIRVERFDHAAKTPTSVSGLPLFEKSGPIVITVARLVWFKGLHTLVEAAAEVIKDHPNVRFLVVGCGELRENLEQQAAELGVGDAFIFAGERNDIPALLKQSDLFVLPSVSEGLPISILEAMAARLPVIATDVGGVPELVEDRETGRLVSPEAPSDLAQAIMECLQDPERMRAYGHAGRQRLENLFSQTAMVEATERLYHTTLYGRVDNDY